MRSNGFLTLSRKFSNRGSSSSRATAVSPPSRSGHDPDLENAQGEEPAPRIDTEVMNEMEETAAVVEETDRPGLMGFIKTELNPNLDITHLKIPTAFKAVVFPNQGRGHKSEFYLPPSLPTKEPFRSLFTALFIFYMSTIFVPFQAITNLPVWHRPRRSWSWKKAMMVSITRRCTIYICRTHIPLAGSPAEGDPRTTYSRFVRIDPSEVIRPERDGEPGDIRGELRRAMDLQGVKVRPVVGIYFAAPPVTTPDTLKGNADTVLLLHMHGGAYWLGTAQESGMSAGFCRDLLAKVHGRPGAPTLVFQVEYRLARVNDFTHGSYPAALLDAVTSYLYLVRVCGFRPENIILSGDSSGGNLALALCRYLRDENIEEQPGSLLLLSPWCDVSRSHSGPLPAPNPFSTTVLNSMTDIIDGSTLYRNSAVCPLLGHLPASEAYSNAYLSPVSLQLLAPDMRPPDWGFRGFPKRVFISTGDAELNYEQHLTLAHRMAAGTVRGAPEYSNSNMPRTWDARVCTWREAYPRNPTWLEKQERLVQDGPVVEALPKEERVVTLDDTVDGVHILPLLKWFEPERSQAIARLADWLAPPVSPSTTLSPDSMPPTAQGSSLPLFHEPRQGDK